VKRDPSLAPLSREHHQALFIAQKLRRASEPEPARGDFLRFWAEHGRDHFRVEEEIVLPAWAAVAEPDREMMARVAIEHAQIRAAAQSLAQELPAAASDLNALGELLNDHVRFEERELFPLVEAALGEEGLARIAPAIAAAEAGDPIE
jgi:hemerythrin-like domain-containing protein